MQPQTKINKQIKKQAKTSQKGIDKPEQKL
jgi:hypothetical protein